MELKPEQHCTACHHHQEYIQSARSFVRSGVEPSQGCAGRAQQPQTRISPAYKAAHTPAQRRPCDIKRQAQRSSHQTRACFSTPQGSAAAVQLLQRSRPQTAIYGHARPQDAQIRYRAHAKCMTTLEPCTWPRLMLAAGLLSKRKASRLSRSSKQRQRRADQCSKGFRKGSGGESNAGGQHETRGMCAACPRQSTKAGAKNKGTEGRWGAAQGGTGQAECPEL